MVAVVRRPAQSKFGQIARSHHQSARHVGNVHEHLSAFARLGVFVSDVRGFIVVAYVLKMRQNRFLDVDLLYIDAQRLGKL